MLTYAKWLWRYYRRHKRALIFLLTFTPVGAALAVVQPLFLKNVFDLLGNGAVKPTGLPWLTSWIDQVAQGRIGAYVIMMIVFGFMGMVAYSLTVGHRAYMNIRLEWEFRQQAFSGVLDKGPDFFNRFNTGDLVTRMTDDVAEKLSWFACSGIFRFYEAMIVIIFSLVMMISLNPALTLWIVCTLPFLVFVYIKSSTLMNRRYDFLQKKISAVNDTMEACFSGIRVVKAYCREEDQRTRFGDVADNRQGAEIAAVKTGAVIESLWMYIWQFGTVIVLVAGGWYVIGKSLSIGEFVAFNSYVMFLMYPMFDVGNFLVRGMRAAVSIKRLMELENHPPMITAEEDKRPIPVTPHGRVEFEKVHFRLPGMERDILTDLNFTVEPGKRVALVGRVGSGKSWGVRLIPRLVDPTAGRILLDGRDLREYDLTDLRRHIGYVPQDPILFSDTIESNIRFHREGITKDTLDWAIDVAQLRNDLTAFPEGLNTRIGVRGMSISGGQKQRLALARALVGKPKILILDDCTSALDASTEAGLWDSLHEVMPHLTCFIITHRPATLEKVDEVVVLDEGRIVERGGHIDLILKEGVYCKLYHRIMLQEAVGGAA
jgi:ATP-binding cassette, subfamily B, multidrug efflux pump